MIRANRAELVWRKIHLQGWTQRQVALSFGISEQRVAVLLTQHVLLRTKLQQRSQQRRESLNEYIALYRQVTNRVSENY